MISETTDQQQTLSGTNQSTAVKEPSVQPAIEENLSFMINEEGSIVSINNTDQLPITVISNGDCFVYRQITPGENNVEIDYQASYGALKTHYIVKVEELERQIKDLKMNVDKYKDTIVFQSQKIVALESRSSVPSNKSILSTSSCETISANTEASSISKVSSGTELPNKRQKKVHYPLVLDDEPDELATEPQV